MIRTIHVRTAPGRRHLLALAVSCWVLACMGASAAAQEPAAPPPASPPAQESSGQTEATSSAAVAGHPLESTPSKRQVRQAHDAYLAGAKKLEHDDLDAAEHEFVRALNLDPENPSYAVAISVTREHRLMELVQQSTKARQAGDESKAQTLLAEARKMDPTNPMVLEHIEPLIPFNALALQAAAGKPASGGQINPLVDRTRMLAGETPGPWRIGAPVLASAIHVAPAGGVKDFNLRGESSDVLRQVASAYGIRVIVDDSVEHKNLRFNLENVTYDQAMTVLMSMAHVFAVPLDETSVLVAKDDAGDRQRLERQLEETIDVPGSTSEQLNELANVVRNVFDVKQATVQTGAGTILVRAPEVVLGPLNKTIEGLIESPGEVLLEVKMVEVNKTATSDVGTTLPTQFTIFNVDAAATSIVNSNQALVQQGIAQGLILNTDSNLVVALKLIAAGLVQSNLATNLIGVFGGGLLQTGISASTNLTLNLSLNSSDSRSLDDVQMRIGDRQEATFREGTRYPITTSTYTTGLSTPASALSNATINGVPVASLLSQFAGGSSATIPQVTYEDLGITLKSTPVIERMGRVNLKLDLKIEALSGSSSDGNPILLSRQFTSDLTLADGESALLVSNVSKTETTAMAGIPGLSELPGFQSPTEQNAERDTGQLVVIVTPHVVRRRTNQVAGPRIGLHIAAAN
jgi:type II secretory pathway component GspD/PulD (secretin)